MDSELQEMQEFTKAVRKVDSELSIEMDKPLKIDEHGKIISGVFWFGLAATPGKVRRKPVSKAGTLQTWAMKYANSNFNYAS
jgi:hypothetical protein